MHVMLGIHDCTRLDAGLGRLAIQVGRMGANEFALAFELEDGIDALEVATNVSASFPTTLSFRARTYRYASLLAMLSATPAGMRLLCFEMQARHFVRLRLIRLADCAGFGLLMLKRPASASE